MKLLGKDSPWPDTGRCWCILPATLWRLVTAIARILSMLRGCVSTARQNAAAFVTASVDLPDQVVRRLVR